MKRFLLLLMVVTIALVQPVKLSADAVYGNDFEGKKSKRIETPERSRYIVNAPEGFAIIKAEPGFSGDMLEYIIKEFYGNNNLDSSQIEKLKSILVFENGQEFIVTGLFKYRGEYWGVMPTSHSITYPGWVPMKDLLVVYTAKDFEIEHKDEIYTYDGVKYLDLFDVEAVVWEWPGSDREKHVPLDGSMVIEYAYKDQDGREWGYGQINYNMEEYDYYKVPREGWICLDDPKSSDIETFNPAPEPRKWEAEFQGFTTADNLVTLIPSATPTTFKSEQTVRVTTVIAMGVTAVILVMGIFVLHRRAKNK